MPSISDMTYAAVMLALISLVLLLRSFVTFIQSVKDMPGHNTKDVLKDAKSPRLPLWEQFYHLHKQYGPVISVHQGRKTYISLGSIQAAIDLLEKRGDIYSSRPRNIMGDILTGGMRGVSMPYGTRWRKWRSLMYSGLNQGAPQSYRPLQCVETEILLADLLEESAHDRYNTHFQRVAASLGYCMSYGRRVRNINDPLLLAQQSLDHRFHQYSEPGRYIVDSHPWLLKLPYCLQWFRWEAEKQRKQDTMFLMSLMNDVKEQISKNAAQPSIAKRGVEKQSDFGLTDEETAFALSSPFAASATTMTSVLQVVILALLHYPEVLKKAQNEIDDVVGCERLPDFEDEESLPYITAVIREALRWRPVAPISVPHCNTTDDVYNSCYIPKGCTVIPNVYAMSKDEDIFPSADQFLPERYLGAGPHSTFYFGFGRRVCPGIHVAHSSLYIIVSRLLWAFEILPSHDSEGKPVLPDVNNFVKSVVRFPVPFPYRLKARSKEKVRQIQQSGEKARALAESMWQ